MYQAEKERVKGLFANSPFTADLIRKEEPITLKEKVAHIYSVAALIEESARKMCLSERQTLMAYTAGLFHDISCVMDISLSGKQYGPRHGARSAIITTGILTQHGGFSTEEIECIANACANHDLATPVEFTGFTETLLSLLRDCDKVDCYRRLFEEPFENTFQRPLEFDASIREDWAKRCLAGNPMKYAEMRNFNEEALLYIGWFFQLKNASCKEAAFPVFKKFTQRIIAATHDEQTRNFARQAIGL